MIYIFRKMLHFPKCNYDTFSRKKCDYILLQNLLWDKDWNNVIFFKTLRYVNRVLLYDSYLYTYVSYQRLFNGYSTEKLVNNFQESFWFYMIHLNPTWWYFKSYKFEIIFFNRKNYSTVFYVDRTVLYNTNVRCG